MRGRRDVAPETLARMNESQFHRGPDEGGMHREPGIGLGHSSLSITDFATCQQPLLNVVGSVAVLCNGELYNSSDVIP